MFSGDKNLVDDGGKDLSQLSYIVIQVLALPHRGLKAIGNTVWGELLQTAREQIADIEPFDDEDRQEALREGSTTLTQVLGFARKDYAFLGVEIAEAIASAHVESTRRLRPGRVEQIVA